MKMLRHSSCAVVLSLAVIAPAFAADSSWIGTWKQDISSNKSTAAVSYTPKGSGFHFSNGGTIQYDFACDGKSYPTYGNQSMTCKMNPDASIDWVTSANGKVLAEMQRTFSADGKIMTMAETIHLDDGTTTKETLVRQRKSGTTGLAGEWVNNKLTEAEADVLTISAKGDVYHMVHAHSDEVVDAKLDGSETKPIGKNTMPGVTVSYKAVAPTKLLITTKLNGKVLSEGTMTLSADGKMYTVESWLPGKSGEKTSGIYYRQ